MRDVLTIMEDSFPKEMFEVMPIKLFLIYSKIMWQKEREFIKCYNFTDEQLDEALKKHDGFIDTVGGVDCYIEPKLKI